MMKTQILHLCIALAILAGVNHVVAQGTAFTYQGRLYDGAILGKGMTSFTEGKGMVLVLVTLQ